MIKFPKQKLFIDIISKAISATVHCGRPRVFDCCGTNMEQFARRNDFIRFPENFQSQTKITFIFGVVSIVSILL